MQKKSLFWTLYWNGSKKNRKEYVRQQFWAWMMDNHPKIFDWCDKHLPFDTLPF